MHKLAPLIHKYGHNAVIVTPADENLIGHWEHFIHIYPDNVQPFKRIFDWRVRWWLGWRDQEFSDQELNVTWNDHLHPGLPLLVVDVLDRTLFYPKETKGKGVLYYNGKGPSWPYDGKVFEQPCPSKHWTEITRHVPASRLELANMLRAAKLLVINDGYTHLSFEAMMCGTPVLSLQPIIRPPFGHFPSLVDNHAAVRKAMKTSEYMQRNYYIYRAHCEQTVIQFLRLCADFFGNGKA